MTLYHGTNADYAAALRKLADLIEDTPDIEVAYHQTNIWHTWQPAVLTRLTRAALRHGAKVTKDAGDTIFRLGIEFNGVGFQAIASRESVCERVVVDTVEVTEMVPDPSLPAPPMVEQTRTEEVVEWRCQPLMALGQDDRAGVA